MPGIKNEYLPLVRKHVMQDRWQDEVGTDFWLNPALLMGTTVAGSNRAIDNGWTLEAEHGVAGSAGDFRGGVLTPGTLRGGIPTTPGLPPHAAHLATGDLVVSPPVFGSYYHMWQAMRIAQKGHLPTKLILETWSAFNVASANEPTSGFGFFEDSTTTTSATEALQLAFISSDSANFQLATNASSTLVSVGEAVSTSWQHYEIVIDYDSSAVVRASWSINGSLQGSIVPTTGEAPYAFGSHTLTTNRLKLGPVHIYYDWS